MKKQEIVKIYVKLHKSKFKNLLGWSNVRTQNGGWVFETKTL